MTLIYTATEDWLSASVVERLVGETGGKLQVGVQLPPRGSGELKRKLPEYIRLAPNIPLILLTDLDRRNCPPALIDDWCGGRKLPAGLIFRIAVREVEAWLLADKDSFSAFARIPLAKLPDEPELLDNPKQTLLNLVSRYSPSDLKQDLITHHAGGPRQGLAYNERLSHFVANTWDPVNAARRAASLARARQRIIELAQQRH